jgi:hypothetical protein
MLIRKKKIKKIYSWYGESIHNYPDKPMYSHYYGGNLYPCAFFFNGRPIFYLLSNDYSSILAHLAEIPYRYSHKKFGLQLKSLRENLYSQKKDYPLYKKMKIDNNISYKDENYEYLMKDFYEFTILKEFLKKENYILHFKLLKNINFYTDRIITLFSIWREVFISTGTIKYSNLDLHNHMLLQNNHIWEMLKRIYKWKIIENFNSVNYTYGEEERISITYIYENIIIPSILEFLYNRRINFKIHIKIFLIFMHNIKKIKAYIPQIKNYIIEEKFFNRAGRIYHMESIYYKIVEKIENIAGEYMITRVIYSNIKFAILLFIKYNLHIEPVGYIFLFLFSKRIISALFTMYILWWQIFLPDFCENKIEKLRNIFVVPFIISI